MATLSPNLEVPMGRVDTPLTITNTIDQERADAGEIAAAAVRSVTLDGVLVDTGATFLSLPADLIAQLGLRVLRDLTISTTAGPQRARLFRNAELAVLGRRATVDVLELPGGTQPLLGVIPMEALGIEPDLVARRLRLLPDGPTDTYVTA
jgi:predicted aspartyl protease